MIGALSHPNTLSSPGCCTSFWKPPRLSCDILTKMEVIPFYSCVSRMSYGFVPLKKDVLEASKQLMGLSNSINKKHLVESNAGRISYMERLLNLKPVEN
jgi:hypothetical protein